MVSSQREAEVSGTVHAHHHMGNWHQNRCSFSQGHPQLLTGLWTHTGQGSIQNSLEIVEESFLSKHGAHLTAGSTKRAESCGVIGDGSAQRVEPVLSLTN